MKELKGGYSKKFRYKKIPLFNAIIICAIGIVLTSGVQYKMEHSGQQSNNSVVPQSSSATVKITKYRSNNYQFTHPLLLIDIGDESNDMQSLKNEISGLIDVKKSTGEIASASVLVKQMNDGHWFSINENEGYNPGSLIKLPVMMTFLRQAEKNPGLLDRKYSLSSLTRVPTQTFNEGNIVPGKNYSVKELLYYMIAKSDNYATQLLNQNLNINEFQQLFTDIGLPEPNVSDKHFTITVNDYSRFMRVLYNASYLTSEDADYALSLLAQCTFRDGMLKELPSGIKVAHKFGEWGEPVAGSLHQLHESGIIYFEGNPYLITIMTKGKEVKSLPNVISAISKLVFDRMTVAKTAS